MRAPAIVANPAAPAPLPGEYSRLALGFLRILALVNTALADGSYPRRLKAWASPELLVIDDVGLGQVKKRDDEPTAAHTLYNLIDRRHGRVSTAVTSNILLSDWGRYLGDATLTAAILDRLAMHATLIDIDGPSYRQHVAEERAATSATRRKKTDAATTKDE